MGTKESKIRLGSDFVPMTDKPNRNQTERAAINAAKEKMAGVMTILDAQLGKSAFVAGDAFCMGDIPVGLITYRYRRLVPDRPAFANLERWFADIDQRAAFKEHILTVPFT